jgi:phospholipase/lecithinase/hemolysin
MPVFSETCCMTRRLLTPMLLLGLLLAPFATPAAASPYSALYSFGDSLSDTGNAFIATGGLVNPTAPAVEPKPPYFNGRFSNGPNWLDQLSARLGLGPVIPYYAGGTNFATGGATITGAPFGNNLATQLLTYATGLLAPTGALFTVWAGSNDVLQGLVTTPAGLQALAQTLADDVAFLAGTGARDFLVAGLPDLGLIPRLVGTPFAAAATAAAAYFNANLLVDLASEALLQTSSVKYLDVFGLLDNAVAHPGAFGFTNVTSSCIQPAPVDYTNPGTPCATPNSYLSWDDIHPTSHTHGIIANAAFALVVPEPASLGLLLVGLAGVVGLRRRALAA